MYDCNSKKLPERHGKQPETTLPHRPGTRPCLAEGNRCHPRWHHLRNRSFIPSMSNASEKRSVWSSGLLCAVDMT